MLIALSVINIAIASAMIGDNYDEIKQYHADQIQMEQGVAPAPTTKDNT